MMRLAGRLAARTAECGQVIGTQRRVGMHKALIHPKRRQCEGGVYLRGNQRRSAYFSPAQRPAYALGEFGKSTAPDQKDGDLIGLCRALVREFGVKDMQKS